MTPLPRIPSIHWRLLPLLALGLCLTACGVKRPLMKPAEIPAYEAQWNEKMQQLKQDRADDLKENGPEMPLDFPEDEKD